MAKKKIEEHKKSWWQILLCKIIGSAFIIFPILLWLSLMGYNSSDPSFNKTATAEVHNFMGTFGAYSADAILATFGLALIIFLAIPVIWGVNLLRFNAFAEYKIRIFAWFVGLLCFACFLDITFSEYLGRFNLPNNLTGSWSRIISRPINTYINMLNFTYNTMIIVGILLFISILSFNFSAGITLRKWAKLFKKICSIFAKIVMFFVNLGKKLANIRKFNEFKELNPEYLANTLKQKENSRRTEPSFERRDPMVETTKSPAPQIQIEAPVSSQKVIDIPQPATAVNLQQSFNPTFDFVKESDAANQNNKKVSKKITPEDIYQSEGIRSFFPKLSGMRKKQNKEESETLQQDLLTVNPQKIEGTKLQQQVPANEVKAKKYTPNVANTSAQPKDSAMYHLPDINLLSVPQNNNTTVYDENQLKSVAEKLESVLQDFGIHGKIVKVRPGPVVTLYELEPAPGIRTARVIGLSDDIARSMAVASVRMAVVSGHNTIGIEIPNEKRETVWLRELLEDTEFTTSKNILNVTLGKDIGGQHVYADLSKMPHLLVAGTTGSGKSVGVNSMILSLLFRMSPEECKLIMIDPKQLEFSMYNGIPHLLTPVITDPAKAVVGLKWAVREMEDRYRAMALLNVRNIAGYNQKVADMSKSGKEIKKTIQVGFDKETGRPIYEEQIVDTKPLPYIVIVVDEMADLMLVAGKEVEAAIQRLAQMARAAGIHLIMSTQRPSVDVITGTIKANFPSRISFHVTTKIDSRTILGEQGAEQLLGMGDMLYMPSGLRPIRVHGCFVTDAEVEKVVEYIKSQGEPQYVSDVTEGELNTKDTPVFDKGEMGGANDDDDLYNQAVAIVRADKKASTSYIQRKLRLGYNRAAILIERMEDEGIVTPPDRVGRREVIGAD